jgi:hypothetical protein
MQLDLNRQEIEALQRVVERRIDELVLEIAKTDARDYRERLRSEEGLMQAIFAKLGCVHPELSSETRCSTDS